MPATPASTPDDATRQRLLDAGAVEFGSRGFRAATVRAIVARAGVNLAAVNYHFDGKLGLYTAVLQQCVAAAVQRFPPDLDVPPDATPEQRLYGFIRATLLRLLDDQACAWHGPMMAREFADPTPALDAVATSAIQPLAVHLAGILRDLAPKLDETSARLCGLSIIGQCFFHRFGRPMLMRLPATKRLPDLDTLATHITAFSLAAVRGLATPAKRKGSP